MQLWKKGTPAVSVIKLEIKVHKTKVTGAAQIGK
jgi:hypothetical protein